MGLTRPITNRIRHALDWRHQAIVDRLDAVADQLALLPALAARVERLEELIGGELRSVLRALAAEEARNRRAVTEVRAGPEYERAWSDPCPLVSITLPTRDRPELLTARALPSALAQTYEHIEVIVVGDAAPPDVAEAVAGMDDPRVVWSNLSVRVKAHPDERRHWLVASGMARNEAARLARGRWLVHLDDDDELRRDAVASLLDRARETGAEVVYGGFEQHLPGQPPTRHGVFPPVPNHFGWQGAVHHAQLPFTRDLVATHLGVPGDMWLLERMLRAGVRFAMLDQVVWDYFPSSAGRG